MYKKILLLICTFILILSLTSCDIEEMLMSNGGKEVLELDENLHNVIETVKGEDGLEGIYYEDELYYIDRWNLFAVTDDSWGADEGDVLLSWNGLRFGYKQMFYSYTKDTPLFIYETALDNVFFNKTYDFFSDTFVINGTDAEIVFSDMTNDFSKHTNGDLRETVCIQLYSKSHPRIRMELELEYIENQWYFSSFLQGPSPDWTVSDVFMQILSENGII